MYLISYLIITLGFLVFFTYIGIRTFEYPKYNATGRKLALEKCCFIIGMVITVILFALTWIVTVPVLLIFMKVSK